MEQIFFEVSSECLAEVSPTVSFDQFLQQFTVPTNCPKIWGGPQKIQNILSINVLLLVVFKILGKSGSSPYPPRPIPLFTAMRIFNFGEHSHMTSDVFWVFLTYLHSLIRYTLLHKAI